MKNQELINWLLRKNKKLAIAFISLLFLALTLASQSLGRLSTHYSMKQFLPKDHALISADDKVKAQFQLAEQEPFFALLELPEKEVWLAEASINGLNRVEEILLKEPETLEVFHIGNIEGASLLKESSLQKTTEQLTVGKLFALTRPEQRKERFLEDPLLSPQLITQDARRTLFLVRTKEDISTARSSALIALTKEALMKEFPQATVNMGGIPAVQAEMNRVLASELKNFLLLSSLASILMLLFFFKNISSLIIPLVIMVFANISALVGMALSGASFTVLSTTLPVLVSVTVISMATHTMLRFASDYEAEKNKNPNKIFILYKSFKGLFLANALTALTTTVGFLAIAFTKVPLIREYGLSVGFGIATAWLSIILLLPPMLLLAPVPVTRNIGSSKARWALWVEEYKKPLFVSITALCAFFLYQGKNLSWNARLFDDLPSGQEVRRSTEEIDRSMGGMIPLDLIISAEQENAWNDPKLLRDLDWLVKDLQKISGVAHATSLADLQRAAALVQGQEFPESRAAAAEINFLYGFSEKNPINKYLSADGKNTRVSIRLQDIPADKMDGVKLLAEEKAKALFPNFSVHSAGMATTVHVLNNELCHELIYGFWQALALIALLLLVVFRSWRWVVVAVLPNLVTPVVLLGVLSLLETPIKPGIALIFSIALGIAFDNTVYLLARLRLIQKADKKEEIPVVKAWWQEGNLCLYSSLAIFAGFSVFLASYFSLNRSFGAYMLVALTGGLLGDLILLPILISLFPKFLKGRLKKTRTQQTGDIMEKKTAIAASLVFTLFFPMQAARANDAEQILSKVEKNVESKDEIAQLKMTIFEASGDKKERSVEIRRKGGEKNQKVLVRLQTPPDLKGTALLSVKEGGNNDQWLFMPSSKQTRRILSSKKSSNFMDSELSYEDLGANTKFQSKVLRQEEINGKKFSVIESTPKVGESSYGKIISWVAMDSYLVGKMEYYDSNQKLLKVSLFSGYKQYDKGVWRAQKIQVNNVQNKRSTVLELGKLALNKGIDDEEFSESALADVD